MIDPMEIADEVPGLYRVVRLLPLRRTEKVDFDTNFNIYDLDAETGAFTVLREGREDQFPS